MTKTLLDMVFGMGPGRKRPGALSAPGFRTFTDLHPCFTSYSGKVYEQELTRAAIERFATACSKLKPEVRGNSKPAVCRMVATAPNKVMTWPRFLSRIGALYDSDGTAFVVPTLGMDGETVTGLFPLKCEYAEVVVFHDEPWIVFHTATGEDPAIELAKVCILTKFQVGSDVFGEDNCLDATLQLIHAQEQAQANAIRNGASIRFIGALNGMVRESDMVAKRKRFVEDNFGPENYGGLMLYDSTFTNIQQIEPTSYTIPETEMQRIQDNVCTYFGCSMDILQNHYTEDIWGAWYEGKVEPFAVQLGEGITRMCFTQREMRNNKISFSSNRLEYASNASKRNMVRDMLDRGVFTLNEAREVLQLPPVPDGDVRVIRGEYVNASSVSSVVAAQVEGEKLPANVHDSDHDAEGWDKYYAESDNYDSDDFEE